jgi:hypothetical protein
MSIKFLFIAIASLYGFFRVVSEINHRIQSKKFLNSLDDPEYLESYMQELITLSGKLKTNVNHLDRIEEILVGIRQKLRNLSVLQMNKVSDTTCLLFTRVNLVSPSPGSKDDIVLYDLNYLISFSQENEELKITSDYYATVQDKILRVDFAMAFIEQYKQL